MKWISLSRESLVKGNHGNSVLRFESESETEIFQDADAGHRLKG